MLGSSDTLLWAPCAVLAAILLATSRTILRCHEGAVNDASIANQRINEAQRMGVERRTLFLFVAMNWQRYTTEQHIIKSQLAAANLLIFFFSFPSFLPS